MNNTRIYRIFRQTTLFVAFVFFVIVFTKALANDMAGTIKTVQGIVNIERDGQKINAAVGDTLMSSDRIVTGADSTVGITLRDNTLLSAGPDSTLQLNRFSFDSTTNAGAIDATVKRGTLSVVSGKIAKSTPENISFHTPSATLGIRGTEFIIDAGKGSAD